MATIDFVTSEQRTRVKLWRAPPNVAVMMLGSRKRTEGAGDGWTTIRRRSIQKKAERNVTGERQAAASGIHESIVLHIGSTERSNTPVVVTSATSASIGSERGCRREQREWLKLCPMCKSHPRMRLMIFGCNGNPTYSRRRDIAHFAAEPVFSDIMRKAARGRRYVRIDIQSSLSDVHADISALPFPRRRI